LCRNTYYRSSILPHGQNEVREFIADLFAHQGLQLIDVYCSIHLFIPYCPEPLPPYRNWLALSVHAQVYLHQLRKYTCDESFLL
jgi:hypothetical protein